jgi:nicotinate-nucleotide pyrophosphorylase (carboxylating)
MVLYTEIEPQQSVGFSQDIRACIRQALAEDIGSGDVTSNVIVPLNSCIAGRIVSKQEGVVAGLDVAAAVFRMLDESVRFTPNLPEGSTVKTGTVIATLFGSTRTILTAERTALNFLGRISGIATLTRQFVDAIAGTRAKILDTRKTAPGLRALDKLAVLSGGGENHRRGLYDMVLIKDNHISCAGSLAEAVSRVRASGTDLEMEVEAATLDDVKTAIDLGVQRILLDNMSLGMMKEAVKLTANRAILEASGNVTLANVRGIAETGVDYISVGVLTHSANVFDLTLKLDKSD